MIAARMFCIRYTLRKRKKLSIEHGRHCYPARVAANGDKLNTLLGREHHGIASAGLRVARKYRRDETRISNTTATAKLRVCEESD